jgi:hypothetical protein
MHAFGVINALAFPKIMSYSTGFKRLIASVKIRKIHGSVCPTGVERLGTA